MSIAAAVARITELQARFGLHRTQGAISADFEGVLSDAARHAGLGRDELVARTAAGPSGVDAAAAGSAADGAAAPAAPLAASLLSAVADGGAGTAGLASFLGGSGADPLEVLAAYVADRQAALGVGGASTGALPEGDEA